MAAKKSSKSSGSLRVGQRCVFVHLPMAGWPSLTGRPCVVVEARQKMNLWCSNEDGSNRTFRLGEWRYGVTFDGRTLYVRREHLKPYDGDEPSTWDEVERLLGLRITKRRRSAKTAKA